MSESEIYRRVYVKMWADAKVRSLSAPEPSGLVLWMHLICGEQTDIIPGLFKIGERAFAEQLGWPLDADLFVGSQSGSQGLRHAGSQSLSQPRCFREAFSEVESHGLVKADWGARLVWVRNGISYNPPNSVNVVKSWRKTWSMLPECGLKEEARQHLRAYVHAMGYGFALAFDEACPLPSGMPKPLPRAIQEQKQEQKRESTLALAPVSDELVEHTVSASDAKALVDHWQAARFKRGEPQKATIASMWMHSAKTIIAMAGGDLDEAKRVVDAYVGGENEYWAAKKWPLSLLAKPRDFEEAHLLVGVDDKPKAKRGGFDMSRYDAQLAAEMAEIEAQNRAEEAARGAR